MKKGIVAAIVVTALVIVIIGVTRYEWRTSRQGQPAETAKSGHTQSGGQAETPAQAHQDESGTARSPSQPKEDKQSTRSAARPPGSPAERYCADDHDKSDTGAISKAGGLVQIFQHESALADAYDCASRYLDHGGDVNAADPRDDSRHLTPLLFAIQRNDPKMVRFMLGQGADPKQRGGPRDIKPYGYAVYQALHNRSTDYNAVIGILDSALDNGPSGASQ